MDSTDGLPLCFPNLNSSCRRLLRPPSEAALLYTLLAFVSLLTSLLLLSLMDSTGSPPLCFPNFNSSCRRLLRPPSEAALLYTLLAFASLLTNSQQTVPRLSVAPAQQRWASRLPMNTVVLFVQQQEACVVERMGRFHRILEMNLRPLLRYVGKNYCNILTQLAQITMRSGLGKLPLDKVFRVSTIRIGWCVFNCNIVGINTLSLECVFKERKSLNSNIVHSINQASDDWGIRCLRYEIKDIKVPPRVKESMQMQSEGTREAAINVAEGHKQFQILASEGEKAEQINEAAGEAQAVLAKAEAKSKAIRMLAEALAKQNGNAAASLTITEQYVSAFSGLVRESNTVLLPSDSGDIRRMVTRPMTIYSTLSEPSLKVDSIKTPTKDTLVQSTPLQ
ncbi:hypothetical protein Q8A73_004253 [Channa argus]|nr:hypothetical protein Q8A73_004253 [Channa argus]